MLNLRPSPGELRPVSNSTLMAELAELDPKLNHYCLRANYCIDDGAYGGSFIDFLERQDTGCFFFPPTSAGADIAVFLAKMPFESGSREEYDKLPPSRLVCFQLKYLTSGAVLSNDNLRHAWETTLPQFSYQGKGKNAAANLRAKFEERIMKKAAGEEMIGQSIGLLVVAGDVNNQKLPPMEGPGDYKAQLFQHITPLNFKFPPKLQEALVTICKLTDKARKQEATELFDGTQDV